MLKLLTKIPFYWTYRRYGWPMMMPFSIVVSVSYRCNSKCKTCDVWRKANDDMTVDEWRQVFAHLGRAPFYLTFTGGEPFMNPQMIDLARVSLERGYKVLILTNAMRPMMRGKMQQGLLALNDAFPGKLTLRVSVDHFDALLHDA